MVLETVWGVCLAALSFWVAAEDSTFRGLIAAVLALSVVTICSLVIAVYYAAFSVVGRAVDDAAVGQTIFDSLFDYAIGVSGEDPGQSDENAKIPTHLSREEVEKTLHDAADHLISIDGPSTKWAGPFFWLAKKIQKISIWATVKVIIKSCSNDGTSVNLFELRDRLASTIDKGVVAYLKDHFLRLSLSAISIVSAVSLLLAYGIRHLPV